MRTLVYAMLLLTVSQAVIAQPVNGYIKDATGQPVSYANILVKGTTRGASANAEGYFEINNKNLSQATLIVQAIGYQTKEVQATLGPPMQVVLLEDYIETDAVVVTGTRTKANRQTNPLSVDLITRNTLDLVQATSLADGLNYGTGMRVETNCQTCNYTQLRINGMPGAYSQILIDGRPVFSPLTGLYGLEMIPPVMIEKVEVVKGGGSAMYGPGAIGGTVNIITRMPEGNNFSVAYRQQAINNEQPAGIGSLFGSSVSANGKTGVAMFGSYRHRAAFDANHDGYSELSKLGDVAVGGRWFRKIGRGTLTANAQYVTETRRGGNKINVAPHVADQAEDRLHHIYTSGLVWEHTLPKLSANYEAYASAQYVERDHYTGIGHVPAYGNTFNLTHVAGTRLTHVGRLGKTHGVYNITLGAEYQADDVKDQIPYYNYTLDQQTQQAGLYAQADVELTPRWQLLAGLRTDKHNLVNQAITTPRLSVRYSATKALHLKLSGGTGFRAPQAFDGDMHIAFAGGGISRIALDPNLQTERSQSVNASANYTTQKGSWQLMLEVGGFYNRIQNVFVLEDMGTDAQGNTILLRTNGQQALVQGINTDVTLAYANKLTLETGFTLQTSRFSQAVAWSEANPPAHQMLRTPDAYGFFTLNYEVTEKLKIQPSATITGPMLVPHMAGAPGNPTDRLHLSQWFANANLMLVYTLKPYRKTGPNIELSAGVLNLLNHYQQTFDTGPNRDSNFVFGPAMPRTFTLGLTINGTLPKRKS